MPRTRQDDDSSKPESRLLNLRNLLLCGTTLTAAYLPCALGTTSLAQQTTGTPGSPGATTALTPGKHTVVFDFKYDGRGFGNGTGVLKVDDKEVATSKIPHSLPFIIPVEETFDVGVATRNGVEDNDYRVPSRFAGKLDKLTVKVGPVQLTSDEHQVIRHARAGANN
jgi:hypothetical protein